MPWYAMIVLQVRNLLASKRGQLALLVCLVLLGLLGLLTSGSLLLSKGPVLPWPWPT